MNRNKDKGFSLIEVALSLTLFSFVCVHLWNSKERVNNYFYAKEVSTAICRVITNDIIHAQIEGRVRVGDYSVLKSGHVYYIIKEKDNRIYDDDIIGNLGFTAARLFDNKGVSVTGSFSFVGKSPAGAIAAVIASKESIPRSICNGGWVM